jgi:hypothetical protein
MVLSRSTCVRALVFVVSMTLAGSRAASAQTAAPDTVGAPTQVISVNPFTLMFKWFNAEYERKLTPNATWGASGSFFSIDGFDYQNANAIVRYYPREALAGFFVGGRFGVYHASDVRDDDGTALGAGFELGYTWLPGRTKNVAVSIGAGVNRLFGGDLHGASVAVPSVRLVNVGFAF